MFFSLKKNIDCNEIIKKILISTDIKKVEIKSFDGGCSAKILEEEEFGVDLNELNVQNLRLIKRPTRLEPEDAFLKVESADGEIVYFER